MLDEGREYYVVFGKAKMVMPFWLDRDFQHCYVVRKEYGKIWTVIEDTKTHLDIHPYLVEDYPDLKDLVGKDKIFVRVNRKIKDSYRGHICLFNCVEVVKAILGIRKLTIFTPKQLYRYLLCQT